MRQAVLLSKSDSVPTDGFGSPVVSPVPSDPPESDPISVAGGVVGFVIGFVPVSGPPRPGMNAQETSGRSSAMQATAQMRFRFFTRFSPFLKYITYSAPYRFRRSVSFSAQSVCFLFGLTYLPLFFSLFTAIIPSFTVFVNSKKRILYYKNRNAYPRSPKT